jgi:HAD superfamily hydrolase (TIGR01509 family)
MAELKALLFDVDGTLADTERDGHRVAFNKAFAAAGLDWDWTVEIYGELLAVTGGKERIKYYLQTYNPVVPTQEDLDGFVAGLHQSKTRFYTAALQQGEIPLRPGVERLLREAKAAGLRIGVATTTTPENVTALIEYSIGPDALGWFDVVAAGDVVPAKKPAPDIYTYAMDQLGLAACDCVAFEDSENGVYSARDAGISTILVTVNDYTRGQDFADATLVLDSMGEPDAPFEVLAGNCADPAYVDLALVRELHAKTPVEA